MPAVVACAARVQTVAMASVSKHVKKAKENYEAAVKQTKRWFGGDSRYENAAELFSKSGLSYKLAKNFTEAADAYAMAAEMHAKLPDSDSDVATAFRDAGMMALKAGDTEKGQKFLQQAASLYEDMDRITTAGKMYKEIASTFEEAHETDKALEFYALAAETFSTAENATSPMNECRAKVAFLYGEQESFGKAAEEFEAVGTSYLKNNLLKFNARTHFTNSVLCYMANDDVVMVTRKIGEFKTRDYQFAESRECKLLEACTAAYDAGDVDAFVDALAEYDRISKLDPWRIALLLRVKEHITTAGGDEEEDLS